MRQAYDILRIKKGDISKDQYVRNKRTKSMHRMSIEAARIMAGDEIGDVPEDKVIEE